LFALPPDLEARLQQERVKTVSHDRRLIGLLDTIFGPDRRRFGYGAQGSTTAAQTWAAGRGDCLSLTILTYAASRAVGLNADMQEVRVPAIYDRRAGVDFVNRHVNLAVRLRNDTMQDMLRTRVAIIDFEPQLTGGELGRRLDENDILARFHNNLGGQALAVGDAPRAYAHYRAAIEADPRYAAAHSNVAVLLEQRGLVQEAELLLRYAVALSPEPDVALAALHRLLLAEHRTADADVVAQQLRAAQDADPYHWISTGVDALNAGHDRQAVAALEHAQQLTNGFTEVHGWLALAYWRLGDKSRAQQQLAQLEALQAGSPLAGKVRRKLTATP
jgi:tetratricopeptide (TPR) repeat protein